MKYGPHTYAQVNVRGSRWFVLLPRDYVGKDQITAPRVNADGSSFETLTPGAVSTHMLVFKANDIKKLMRLNLHYCELEETK